LALYEGLKQGRLVEPAPPHRETVRRPPETARGAARPVEAAAWRSLRSELKAQPRSAAPFMDRFLGSGSVQTLQGVAGALFGSGRPRKQRRPAPVSEGQALSRREARGLSEARMQVVGGGESHLPQGRRGLGRAFLVVLALAGTMAALRPWQKAGILKADWSALFRLPDGEGSSGADQQALAAGRQDAEDAAKLAALPFQAGTGTALGLWQDSAGRWWRVDGEGALAPCADPEAAENLGLPEIRGAAAHAEEYRGGRRLLLNLPPGRLAELLPLEASVASEVMAVDVQDPTQPVLLTLDGVRCLMGDQDWGERQEHLALVLADLAARRRRARQIDLRFEGTAVVRPL
jgi:Cell division protein FtsQ